MVAIRAVLIALTVFITATFPLLVREIGPAGDGTVYANWGAGRRFLVSASDNNNQAPPEIVIVTATPAPAPPTATKPPAAPVAPPPVIVAPPPPPPPPPPPAAAVAAAPAQAPRQLPKTGESEFGLYGLAALGALLVLGAAGVIARRGRA